MMMMSMIMVVLTINDNEDVLLIVLTVNDNDDDFHDDDCTHDERCTIGCTHGEQQR